MVIRPKKQGIDLLSQSAVIRSMDRKGVGLLYVNKRVKIRPILFGGGQQKGMRSGTGNVPEMQDWQWLQSDVTKTWMRRSTACTH